MARQQVSYTPPAQDNAEIRPVAQPRSVAYVPAIPKKTLLPVQELAGLSDSLQKVNLEQTKRENEAALEEGRRAGVNADQGVVDRIAAASKDLTDKENAQKANQAAFAKEVAAGNIHVSENPWARIGFIESSARNLMSKYRDDLDQNMKQATATVDDQTGQPVPAKPTDQIIQETWAKYANNPFLQDHYGGKVMVEEKYAADAAFHQQASRKLGEEQSKAQQQNFTNETYTSFLAQAHSHQPIDQNFVDMHVANATNGRLKGVEDVRQGTYDAIVATSSELSRVDPNDAARWLDESLKLKVGNTTIGDDANYGAKVRNEIRLQQQRGLERGQRENAAHDDEQRKQEIKATSDLAAYIADKRKQDPNFNEQSGRLDWIRQFKDTNGAGEPGITDTVADRLTVRTNNAARESSASTTNGILAFLHLSHDPEMIRNLADAKIANGEISEDDHKRVADAISSLYTDAPILNSDAVKATTESLTGSLTALGLSAKIRADNAGPISALLAQRDQSMAEDAADLRGQSAQERRDEVIKRAQARDQGVLGYKERLAALVDGPRKELESTRAEVRLARAHWLPVPAETMAKVERLMDPGEIETIDSQNVERGNQSGWLAGSGKPEGRPAGQAFQDELEPAIKAAYGENPENLTKVTSIARGIFNAQLEGPIRGILASTDPDKQQVAVEKQAREIARDYASKTFKSDMERIASNLGIGKPAEALSTSNAQKTSAESSSLVYDSMVNADSPTARAEEQLKVHSPYISNDALTVVKRAITGGVLPGSLEHAQAQNRVVSELNDIYKNPNATDSARLDAMMGVAGPIGLISYRDIEAGKVTIRPSSEWDVAVGAYKTAVGNMRPVGVPKAEAVQSWIDSQTRTIPLDKATYRPFTDPYFPTPEAVDYMQKNQPERFKTLAAKVGINVNDPAQMQKFPVAQKALLKPKDLNAAQ